ncbi:MAG: tetratricopeptide repeat protein, partial [Myxococcales bacterium]
VHEERRDYAQAASAQGRLVALGDGSRSVLAHLLAEAALAESDGELARQFAERAAEVEPHSAHASFARGLILLKHQKGREAASALMKACVLDPEIAGRAAEPLVQAAGEAGPAAVVDFFSERIRVGGDHAALRLAIARCQRQQGRVEDAVASLRRALDLDPRFVEARVELGRTLLESSMGSDVRREFDALLAGFGTQTPGFACRACGQGYTESHFRCARCLGWDTVRRGPPPEPGMLREAPQPRERADGK